jgi:hypothetical protein
MAGEQRAEEESAIVRISEAPSGPYFGTAFGEIILTMWPPRTKTSVGLLVNPAPSGEIAGVSAMHLVDSDSKELLFDLANSPVHSVAVGGRQYEIRLLHVGEAQEEEEECNWFWYEFQVSR